MVSTIPDILSPDLAESELLELRDKYPASSLVWFRLMKYYFHNDNAKFEVFSKKASLFFPDHYRTITQMFLEEHETIHPEVAVENEVVPLPEPKTTDPEVLNVFHTPEVSNIKNEPAVQEEQLFEPLYTVDYFASQGIKMTEEAMINDKLGKQVKSFTEWIKSMKKLQVQKVDLNDEVTDRKVESIAEQSNSAEDVLTEAMAEVLVKQGKSAKAIEIYDKLSLLNPSKSAYFAARAQALKQ